MTLTPLNNPAVHPISLNAQAGFKTGYPKVGATPETILTNWMPGFN